MDPPLLEAKDIWQVCSTDERHRRTASLLLREHCWHVDLNNAAVQWGWTVETRPALTKWSMQRDITLQ